MARYRTRLYSVWFAVHFLFLLAVSAREMFWLLARKETAAPASLDRVWQGGDRVTGAILGEKFSYSNPARRALYTYLDSTGIEGGYGYFAPNVPNAFKLVFELRYPDGRVEYDLPLVKSSAAGLRMVSLLEKLVRPSYAPIREYAIRLIANSAWHEHPEATQIHAIFSAIKLPSMTEYERGGRASYEVLFTYDFRPEKYSDETKSP